MSLVLRAFDDVSDTVSWVRLRSVPVEVGRVCTTDSAGLPYVCIPGLSVDEVAGVALRLGFQRVRCFIFLASFVVDLVADRVVYLVVGIFHCTFTLS